MKQLIRKLLKEQLTNQDKELLNNLKGELRGLEEDYDDIILKYNLLKKKIDVLEFMENIPYKLTVYHNQLGTEYYQINLRFPFIMPSGKSPYYRIYLGPKVEMDRLSDSEKKERIKYRINQYIKDKLFDKLGF
jgi:hypothetical protein